PGLTGQADAARAVRTQDRAQVRPALAGQLLLGARLTLRADGPDVDVVPAVAVGAVPYPGHAVLIDRDGTAHDVLLGVSDRDGLAPLTAAVGLHHHLVGELRLVERLEVLGLFLVRLGLDAAVLVAVVVGDVGHPKRAVGAVGGRGEVVLGL